INQLESLGYVMALTRNDQAVHETKGRYKNVNFKDHAGVVLGENIDLRIFQKHWEFGFAAPVENPRKTLRSLQFFDSRGVAIHKVYMMNEEHLDNYTQLIEDFRHPDQSPSLSVTPIPDSNNRKKDDEVDVNALLDMWSNLQSTHDFYPMLRDHNVARLHAIRLGEGKFTRKVANNSTQKLLHLAAEREVPIMVFVGSRGVVQIHSGVIENVKTMKNWLNILDPEFNLHLREDKIAASWVVQKPSEDGIITSLELFDEDDNLMANFFGKRKMGVGMTELESWRNILNELD
ncbi:MAG TPA: ChuX/HutX family heme-like substrate-binding protein, partial [Fodinibius sp.]|nr:ChuX/HutX family heme-like substrate-binding protein [Fodinibius sp.]